MIPRAVRRSWACLALAALLLPAAGTPGGAPAARPSLLLVVLDTWRWDYLGASGSGRVDTPNLDRLAREGSYAPEVVTPYPLTTPAHATLFTGLFPLGHGVLDCVHYRLPEGVPTLSESFRGGGYATAAVVSSETLARRFGLDRGFASYEDACEEAGGPRRYASGSRDGAETTRLALRAAGEAPPGKPLFLWVHYFDLHLPYRHRPEWDARYPEDPYAAQAAFLDGEVGKLVRGLRADTSRTWRVAVVGDHGEGLGDHGEFEHGMALYRSTLHVPLILWPRPERPQRMPQPWSLADLAPTLLDWFGLPPMEGAHGRSLFQKGTEVREVPCLTLLPSILYGVNPVAGLRRGGWMYMRHGREELYDLPKDPSERADLSREPGSRGQLEKMRDACAAALPADRVEQKLTPNLRAGSREMQALFSLGYVGGPVTRLGVLQRADVGVLLKDVRALEEASVRARGRGGQGPLKDAYRGFLKRYPRSFYAARNYGRLLLEWREFSEAEQVLTAAARLDPGDPMTLTDLGNLKMGKGRYAEARLLFEKALEVDGDNAAAHLNLGLLYEKGLGDSAKAAPHFRRFLELAPDAPEARRVRAFLGQSPGTTPP